MNRVSRYLLHGRSPHYVNPFELGIYWVGLLTMVFGALHVWWPLGVITAGYIVMKEALPSHPKITLRHFDAKKAEGGEEGPTESPLNTPSPGQYM